MNPDGATLFAANMFGAGINSINLSVSPPTITMVGGTVSGIYSAAADGGGSVYFGKYNDAGIERLSSTGEILTIVKGQIGSVHGIAIRDGSLWFLFGNGLYVTNRPL